MQAQSRRLHPAAYGTRVCPQPAVPPRWRTYDNQAADLHARASCVPTKSPCRSRQPASPRRATRRDALPRNMPASSHSGGRTARTHPPSNGPPYARRAVCDSETLPSISRRHGPSPPRTPSPPRRRVARNRPPSPPLPAGDRQQPQPFRPLQYGTHICFVALAHRAYPS